MGSQHEGQPLHSTAAGDIQAAWLQLAKHGRECTTCTGPVTELSLVPSSPGTRDYELYDALCVDGQALFGPWRNAKTAQIDTWKASAPMYPLLAGLEGRALERRRRALDRIPAAAYKMLQRANPRDQLARVQVLERSIGCEVYRGEIWTADGTDRPWYHWTCLCGAEGGAENGRAAAEEYELHVQEKRRGQTRTCRRCGRQFTAQGGGEYCSAECRRGDSP